MFEVKSYVVRKADKPFSRFEAQLTAVKERLEAAKVGSTRGLASPTSNGGFNFSSAGSRIAKPLRGGGGDGPVVPAVASLQQQEASNAKRSSWFFNQRG